MHHRGRRFAVRFVHWWADDGLGALRHTERTVLLVAYDARTPPNATCSRRATVVAHDERRRRGSRK
jgi:hypothetical protein